MTSIRALALGLTLAVALEVVPAAAQLNLDTPGAPPAVQPATPDTLASPDSPSRSEEPASPQEPAPAQHNTEAVAPPSAAQPAPDQNPAPATVTAPEPAPATPTPTAPEPAPTPAAAPLDPKDVKLQIASAGGAYMKSQELAYFQPFAKRTGYTVNGVAFDGTLAALKAQGSTPAWDVVDLNQDVAAQACREGLLEPLDTAMVQPGPDGTPPAEDFLAGAIQPCAVASTAWSAVIIYDKALKTHPAKAEHFFDLKKYPGKRALPRTPQHTLELALLADGVAPGEVYTQLASKEGQDKAFAKLNEIKSQIVWWDRAADAADRVASKQAAMGLAFNGRAFMAMIKGRQPISVLWDHQIYHLNTWAIPKGARHAGPAREFIGFATSTGPMSDQTRWMPYGPVRLSAVKLAGKHAELNLDMKAYLPTSPSNLEGALAFDASFWAQQQALSDRFSAWIEGREPAAESATSQ